MLVVITFWILAIFVKKIILKAQKKISPKYCVFRILGDFFKISIILLGLVTALGTAGINVSAIVASLGLSGFAIGFALKDYLSNILSGFMILIYQPYNIGDRIIVSGSEGKVVEINLRYTILSTEDRKILIPNSNMINCSISILNND